MPHTQYQVRVYSPTTGNLLAALTNWHFLELNREVNNFSSSVLSLNLNDAAVQHFLTDTIIEIWRRNENSSWYIEDTLFHRTGSKEITEQGIEIFISYGRGLLDLLHRRVLLYYANLAQTLKSGPGETVIKEFVNENCGSLATIANGRLKVGITLGLALEPDLARGTSWAGARAWQNVLEIIQEIAKVTSVDFDIIRTGSRVFEFRCYYPQRGVDRSASLLFSPRFGNMTNIFYTQSRAEEVTSVAVLGEGEESSRNVIIMSSNAIIDSPWNDIETTIDARNQPTITEMQSNSREQLEASKKAENFTFDVIQTDARRYGEPDEYWLGDIVKIDTGLGPILTKKLSKVQLVVSEGNETVDLEFSDVVGVITI